MLFRSKALVIRDLDLLKSEPELCKSILSAPANPDECLKSFKTNHLDDSLPRVDLRVVDGIA